jgi:hypothetical protein
MTASRAKHLGPIVRLLLLQLLAIAVFLPLLAFGLGHLEGLTPGEIWATVLRSRVLLLLVIPFLLAGKFWFEARYAEQLRRQRPHDQEAPTQIGH